GGKVAIFTLGVLTINHGRLETKKAFVRERRAFGLSDEQSRERRPFRATKATFALSRSSGGKTECL
ncbi:hypothetical protein SUGI_0919850, partial [Cryptomeria japonica]